MSDSPSAFRLAIDLGASGGRAIVGRVDHSGLQMHVAQRFQYAPRQANGHLRWDFRALSEGLYASIQHAVRTAESLGRRVASVAVDGWGVDYGLVDEDGRLLEDPVCYRDDRTSGMIEHVCSRMPATEIFERTGIQFLALNTLSQLAAHVREGLPPRAKRLLLIPDLCHHLLCGSVTTERTNASTTQLLGFDGRWETTLFDRLDLPIALMPDVVNAGTRLGTLMPALRQQLDVDALEVIAPATHDTASAVAGTPLKRGWAYISSGTWSLVGIERTSPLVTPAAARANFTNEAGVCGTTRFLKNVMGLWILDACAKEWAAAGFDLDRAALIARVAALDGCVGLLFPDHARFFNPPSMHAEVRAALAESGQRAHDDPVLLAKVILDSLALRYASVITAIESLTGSAIEGIHIVGGGARNSYLNQATADATGRRVLAGPTEATAAGNLMMQAMTAGEITSLADARALIEQAMPPRAFAPRSSASWADAAKRYEELVTALLLALLIAAAAPFLAAAQPSSEIDGVARLFNRPPDDSRIMMRWWWFGPSVTREELENEMRLMKEGGIGGFEVATVYPMAVDDPARGLRNYDYLSPEFLDHVGFAAGKARELGLRMDMTLGSGWSYGGPYITRSLAASRLRSERREIAPGTTDIARPVPYEHERLIAAFVGRGAVREVDAASFRELDISRDGRIALPPGSGPRTVVFYFSAPTGQVVKRAALGAEGYVLDHYNRAAIETHLREAGEKLVAAAGPGGIHAIFCDSLEVYEADWTGDMLEEFRRRRGYDLRPLLPLLEFGAGDRSSDVRRDLGRTQTELFEERFLQPMRDWTRRHNVRFRIQNYGAPPASLASHRLVDLIDGEGFEWRTLSRTRWASSAAHLFRRPVAASETWTWIHSPAFRATPLDLKAEADLHFLAGINQLIGHGWPYSPPQAGSPGWPFYAAGVFSDVNPWWPVMPDVAAYLHRVSFLLRQGEPVADVGLYAPTDDARAAMRPGQADYLNLYLGVRDRLGPRVVPAILDAGYNFDVFDDGTLAEAAARSYKAIVVPRVRRMPDATKRWLAEYTQRGGAVISDENVETDLKKAVPRDVEFVPASPEIGFVHRRLADADIYFFANTSNVARRVRARPRDRTAYLELWDPVAGIIEKLDAPPEGVALSFEPYESKIAVFRRQPSRAPLGRIPSNLASADLQSGWSVTVGNGAAAAVDLPYSWTDHHPTRFFSGTASYRTTVQVPAAFRRPGVRAYLDFGAPAPIEREPLAGGTLRGNSFAALVAAPVREAATVFVNGRRAGTVWAPPYRVDITNHVRAGSNEIRIDVYNTAINALAAGGTLVDVTPVVERYGQRFRLQDMDEFRPLPSGLLAVPRLVAEK